MTMRCPLLCAEQLVFLALAVLARAMNYMDDTNSTIQILPAPYRWNLDTRPWVANTDIFNHTASDIFCGFNGADCRHAIIPFTGSGIAIYVLVSLAFNAMASFIMDGGPATLKNNDHGDACSSSGPSICHSTVIYDVQSLMFGNHVLDISAFPYLKASGAIDSHCHLDYAIVNDTHAADSFPSPPTSSTPPAPLHRSGKTAAASGGSIGGVTLIVGAVILTVLYNRRRSRRESRPEIDPDLKALETDADVALPSSSWSPDLPPMETSVTRNRQLMSEPMEQMAPPPIAVNALHPSYGFKNI